MNSNKMNLFYILKLNISYILENNCKIDITFEKAKKNNLIISLGDNQLLKFIRNIKNIVFSEELIETKYKNRNEIKSLPDSDENRNIISKIQNEIDEYIYVPDLISIKADTTKKDYKFICNNFFEVKITVNTKTYNMRYKRLCAGAGQLRRNSALFVNENIYNELQNVMMCGLTSSKIKKINLAKFSAYYALYTSTTRKITTPNICVVKDFEYTLHNQNISWIFDNSDGEKDIENRVIDIEQNAFDGSGMVCPNMAKKWMEDLSLDYLPSSFILRSAWIKGLVSVFDFKDFAENIAKKEYIIDAWENKKLVKDIDVILTTSQFKMWKKYQNWEEYMYYHKTYGHTFGVARVNKKENNTYTALNYQYIQSNNFDEERIKKLSDFSIDWIKSIMTGDKLSTMLFLIGCHNEDDDKNDIENELNSYMAKTLMYNDSILNDSYVRDKISSMLEKKINQLKIGKLLVEGSYDFAIPDLYAMAEHAFGLDVKGLLASKQVWNKRWVNKGSTVVSMMRSPLVAPSENQLMNIYSDEKCLYWFKYIQSGNVFNIWDTALMRASDADYDGDLLLSSDNDYLVQSVRDELYPITYKKNKAKEQRLNFNNFANMDVKSFNSKIGFITNLASNFIAMMESYSPESEEYKTLKKRVDLLRFYQGSAIDATKGDIFIPPPKHWSKKQKYINITDSMTDKQKEESEKINKKIFFENKITGDKKPYFFGYVYPKYMKEYKNHIKSSNRISEIKYGSNIKELSKKENRTSDEKQFIRNFYKYTPLLSNNCTMNTLARYVEDAEFDNKYKKIRYSFDYRILMSDNFYIDDNDLLNKVIKILKDFNTQYAVKTKEKGIIDYYFTGTYEDDDEDNCCDTYYSYLYDLKEKELLALCSNIEKLTNYVIFAYYTAFQNKSKSLLWTTFGEQILKNIKLKSKVCYYPIEDENGQEYLGKKYVLKEINL